MSNRPLDYRDTRSDDVNSLDRDLLNPVPPKICLQHDAQQDEIESLKQNQIPIEIAEKLKLIPLDSLESEALQGKLQSITDRLLSAIEKTDLAKKEFSHFGPEYKDVQFAVSSDESSNACILKHTVPPIICINKGLLIGAQAVTTLDALAFVIAHELSHKALESKYGTGAGSKGEEGIADVLGLELAHHAGFDIREAITFIRQIRQDPQTPDERLAALLAVHPQLSTRLGIIQAGITSIEKGVEKLSIIPTPISQTGFPEMAQQIVPIPLREPSSFMQAFERDRLPRAENSQSNLISGIIQGLGEADFNDYRTIKDLKSLLKEMRLQKGGVGTSYQVNSLADLAISIYEGSFKNKYHPDGFENKPEGKIIYDLISDLDSLNSSAKSLPLGRFSRINEAIVGFLEGQNKKEIHLASKNLLALLEQEALKDSDLFKGINWSQFKLRLKQDSTVSWQPMYEAATLLPTSDRQDVIKALLTLGVDDTRLYSHMNLGTYLEAVQGNLRVFPGPSALSKTGDSILTSNIEISRSGSIQEFGKERSDLALRLRSERLSRIPKLAEQTFAQLQSGDPSNDQLKQLLVAANMLEKFHREHSISSDYLIGLQHIDKHPEAFCRINKTAINSNVTLQNQVVSALQEMINQDMPTARDTIRAVFGIGNRHGLEPFFFRIKLNDDNVVNRWETEEGAIMSLPLAKWLIELPSEYVTSAEKLKLLFNTESTFAATVIVVSSDSRMATAQTLLKADYPEMLIAASSFKDLFKKHEEFSNKSGDSISKEAKLSLLEAEFRQLSLKQIPKAEDIAALNAKISVWSFDYDPTLSEHLRKHFINSAPQWSDDPKCAVNEWIVLHDNALLPPNTAYQMLENLLGRVDSQSNLNTKTEIYENILGGVRIADPALREKCIRNWAETIQSSIGQDNLSSEFTDALRDSVDRIANINPVLRTEMLDTLGKTLLTQQEATKIIEAGLPSLSRDHLEDTQSQGVILEEVLSLTRRDSTTRKDVFHFLITPLSRSSINQFLDIVPKTVPTFDFLPEEGDKEFKELFDNQRAMEAARNFHRNFWAAPFEARTLLARELFMPADDTSPEQYEEMFNLALSYTFPKERQYSEQAKQFVKSYVKNVPEYSRELAISALMVAAEKTSETQAGVGFALASFLETMGPAETKAGQAADSHPSVPSEIRKDLGRLKTHANEPTRWQLWEQIENNVPEHISRDIASVGSILGAASFYVVAEVTMRDGSQKVLALLRNHALTRAENGFGLMSDMAIDLGKDHRAFNTLEELIDQAKELAKMESNPILSKDQLELAQTIYNGTKVVVDGSEYEFKVPNVTAVGPNFRLMDKAPGKHFRDILKGADEKQKRELAKGIAAVEINNILRGLPFDDDRHGGNCKIEGFQVSHYDFGGMMLEKPSDEELRVFSRLVLNAIEGSIQGKDFSDAYFNEMKALRDSEGQVPPMVKRAQKAFLSLGDYRSCFKDDDVFDVLVSAAAHSPHPILQEVATQRAMSAMMSGVSDPSQAALFQKFLTKIVNPPIKIVREI